MNAVVAPRIFLEDGIETVSREGGGLLEIVVVRRAEARRLLQRASNGDRAAQQVLVAVILSSLCRRSRVGRLRSPSPYAPGAPPTAPPSDAKACSGSSWCGQASASW
jgi:hypothetical protein